MKDICEEKGIKFELPEDMSNLMKRAVELHEHVKLNKKDLHNLRGQHLIESKIRRLAKYYKREGILPPTWAYSLSAATLQVE
jgi:small subunit ribosomal protein S15